MSKIFKDISDVPSKTAEILSDAIFIEDADDYHENIVKAAKAMVKHGHGEWRYATQWSSGTTLWGYIDKSCIVHIDGTICF